MSDEDLPTLKRTSSSWQRAAVLAEESYARLDQAVLAMQGILTQIRQERRGMDQEKIVEEAKKDLKRFGSAASDAYHEHVPIHKRAFFWVVLVIVCLAVVSLLAAFTPLKLPF